MDRRVAAVLNSSRNPSGNLRLANLAKRVGLSPRRIQQLLKLHTGGTFQRRRGELQMRLARKLLKRTYAPIKVIAGRCGFNNLAAFCRQFRKINGCTPTRFRATPKTGT